MFRALLLESCVVLWLCAPASAGNLLFILDSSGSMAGKVDNKAKIETAKSTLSKLIADLPQDTKVGLMAYGHRDKSSCTDVEVLLPIGHASAAAVSKQLGQLVPNGKTPIAHALEKTADAFVGLEKGYNNVVLISDGRETCAGDPCAVAGTIARSNINVRVHVVGFAVPQKDREQLECIAKLGNGQYFAADSIKGFAAAVSEVVKVAQPAVQPPPAPAPSEPTRERIFFDDFDGDQLNKHWTVDNSNPDGFVVENGKLLMFSGQKTGFDQKDMPNLITLNTALPNGDWDVIVKFSGELNSGRDRVWVGLRKNDKDFLAASVVTKFTVADDYHGDQVTLDFRKHTGGKPTETPELVFGGRRDDEYKKFVKQLVDGQAAITLSKRGRSYFASLSIDGPAGDKSAPSVWTTKKLTSLTSPGPLTLGVSLWEKAAGEALVHIDSVEILTVRE